MIRRKAWFRTLATSLAVWLPLVAGEPGVLQPCAMHGAGRAVVATLRGQPVEQGMIGDAPAAATSHKHHGATSQPSASADQSSSRSGHDHHTCSCIDGCSAASDVSFVAPEKPVAELAVSSIIVRRSVPSVETLARPAPEYSRPYTTGPPRA